MIIGFVPARCGSKSIPLKNIKPFCGKPLIYWVLEALNGCPLVDVVFVATDCEKIKRVVESFGFPKVRIYIRSPESATDEAPTEDVMLEFIQAKKLKHDDIFVLVQATNPFLTSDDLCNALDEYLENDFDSMLSVVRFKRFLWDSNGSPINYDYKHRPRRQEFQGILLENGAFYINTVGNILKHRNRLSGRIGFYEMPEYTWVELDEPDDWILAEHLMRKYQRERILRSKTEIKLFLSDVDGTLTDGGMYYSSTGELLKKFNTRDGMGFELLRKTGIKVGIITSEKSEIARRRAEKLKLDFVLVGVQDKLKEVQKLCEELSISLREVAYIGDDINDLPLLRAVGLSACPGDAVDDVKNAVDYIATRKGGEGCVREFIELILNWREKYAADS